MRAALVVLVAACGSSPDDTRAWQLTRDEWEHTVVPEFRSLYDDYARAFVAARPALVTAAAKGRPWTTHVRQHYAGDPDLTLGQARTRWALPVMAPAFVHIAESPLDAVFVRTPRGWGAIVGVDTILVARVAALEPSCARHLEQLGARRCQEIGAMVATAALRGQRERLVHACALAATACAQPW